MVFTPETTAPPDRPGHRSGSGQVPALHVFDQAAGGGRAHAQRKAQGARHILAGLTLRQQSIGEPSRRLQVIASTRATVRRVPTLHPATYSDVVWNVESYASGWSGCTELRVDATGDLVRSVKLSVYGILNCGFGGYGVVGSAYFGFEGSFNMSLLVGNGAALQCVRWMGLGGACQFFNTGFNLGPAFLTLR